MSTATLDGAGKRRERLVSVFPDQPYIAWSASKVRDAIGILQWSEGVLRSYHYHLFAFGGPRRAEMHADALTNEMACTLTQIIGLPKGWVWAVHLLGHSYVLDATQPEQTFRTAAWHRGAPTAWTRSANGRYAASANETIILLDTASLRPTFLRSHDDVVTAMTFTADEAWLISADRSGMVAVWDAATGNRLAWTSLHNGTVRAMVTLDTAAAQGRADTLISAGDDGIYVTRLPSLIPVKFYQTPLSGSGKVPYAVLTLAVGPEGAFISGDTWGVGAYRGCRTWR